MAASFSDAGGENRQSNADGCYISFNRDEPECTLTRLIASRGNTARAAQRRPVRQKLSNSMTKQRIGIDASRPCVHLCFGDYSTFFFHIFSSAISGLPFCCRIVNLHNSDVQLLSAPGTSIAVLLHRRPAALNSRNRELSGPDARQVGIEISKKTAHQFAAALLGALAFVSPLYLSRHDPLPTIPCSLDRHQLARSTPLFAPQWFGASASAVSTTSTVPAILPRSLPPLGFSCPPLAVLRSLRPHCLYKRYNLTFPTLTCTSTAGLSIFLSPYHSQIHIICHLHPQRITSSTCHSQCDGSAPSRHCSWSQLVSWRDHSPPSIQPSSR